MCFVYKYSLFFNFMGLLGGLERKLLKPITWATLSLSALNFSGCGWDPSLVAPGEDDAIGSCDTPGTAVDVAVNDIYAYIADGSEGLQVVDVSNSSKPFAIGFCDIPGSATHLDVEYPYICVADGSGSLRVVDVSSPINPSVVGSCVLPFFGEGDICVKNDFAYVASISDQGSGFSIVDFSNPENPDVVGSCSMAYSGGYGALNGSNGIDLIGDDVYITDGPIIHRIDVSNPLNPFIDNSYNLPFYVNDIFVKDFCAYVAGGSLNVVDVSDSDAFDVCGDYGTSEALGVHVGDSYLYVASGSKGLKIFELGECGVPDDIEEDYQNGVTDSNGHVQFVDISGEEVDIYVKNEDGVGLSDKKVDAFFDEDYNIFIATGVSGDQYLPGFGFWSHNSSHEIILEENVYGFGVASVVVYEGEDAGAIMKWKNDYGLFTEHTYVKTVDKDEVVSTFDRMFGVCDIIVDGFLYVFGIDKPPGFSLQNVYKELGLEFDEGQRFDMFDYSGSEVGNGAHTIDFVPSNVPWVTIDDILVEEDKATVLFSGYDNTTYDHMPLYAPSNADITVYLGRTLDSDFDFYYSFDGSGWTGGTSPLVFTSLMDGDHTIDLYCNDEVANISDVKGEIFPVGGGSGDGLRVVASYDAPSMSPSGLAWDEDNSLMWCSDFWGDIYKLDGNMNVLETYATGLQCIEGLALDSGNSLWTYDTYDRLLCKFDSDMGVVSSYELPYDPFVRDITFEGGDYLWYAYTNDDFGEAGIARWHPSYGLKYRWFDWDKPCGIACDSVDWDRVWVGEANDFKVYKLGSHSTSIEETYNSPVQDYFVMEWGNDYLWITNTQTYDKIYKCEIE